jgi:hypothetical protein
MRVFSYVVVSDSGFAPNPFHGTCTLASCKPQIRRSAKSGDVIVGMSSRCVRVVYAMRVGRVLDFDGYWSNAVGAAKKPVMSSTVRDRRGDNFYEPLPGGGFRQHPSLHTNEDGTENQKHLRRDLGGEHVLVGDRFAYFGKDGPPLPSELAFLRTGRSHRCKFSEEQVLAVADWFERLPQGVLRRPARWPSADTSWMDA